VSYFGSVCSGCYNFGGTGVVGHERKRKCYNSGTGDEEYNFGFHMLERLVVSYLFMNSLCPIN